MPKWPVTMGDIKFVIESDSEPTRAQMSAEYDRLKSLRLAQEERGQEFARTSPIVFESLESKFSHLINEGSLTTMDQFTSFSHSLISFI